MDIVGRECKFVLHAPILEGVDEDIHIIKEVLHYEDGRKVPNLKILKDFKRPFWITKPHFQNHDDKKESESLDKLNRYTSTQNRLHKEIGIRLGPRYTYAKSMRDVVNSPYLYGTDIDSKAIIKKLYICLLYTSPSPRD